MKSICKSHNFLQIFLTSTGLGLSQQIYNLATPLCGITMCEAFLSIHCFSIQ